MKSLTKWMLLPALAMAAVACSSDKFDEPDNGSTSQSQVYLTFHVQPLGDGSRSSTQDTGDLSNSGVETASSEESTITKVVFVIVDPDNGTVIAKSNAFTGGDAGKYTTGFNSSELLHYVGATGGKQALFYAFCNIEAQDIDATAGQEFDADQVFAISDSKSAWAADNFWMTNADNTSCVLTIPSRAALQGATTAETAYDMNDGASIKVERVCARFDYKANSNCGTPNVYNIYNYNYDAATGTYVKDDTKVIATITLRDMALINNANHAYALRRVSANGTATGAVLMGRETSTNYVVDWDWEAKQAWEGDVSSAFSGADNYVNYFSGRNVVPASEYWTNITDLTVEDNDLGGWPSASRQGYMKYSYLMPNALPGINAQIKGITTGVVFRGQLQADDSNTLLKDAINNGAAVLVYGNVVCCDYAHMSDFLEPYADDDPLKVAFNEALADIALIATPTNEQIRGILKNHGFKIVVRSEGLTIGNGGTTEMGYFVYYYYWNRHNDNGNNSVMGPMEFAVVRNNVYKLSVTDINMVGHTNNPDYDPDPEDPTDPDENGKIYLKVSVDVLPWVVRINDIEF